MWRPRLDGSWKADPVLGRLLPSLLWLRQVPDESCDGTVLVWIESGSSQIPLIWEKQGIYHTSIDLDKAINGLLHEHYRPELVPPITTILPFNYSLLPNFIKGTAEKILSLFEKPKPILFPNEPYDTAADFLIKLSERLDGKKAAFKWPENKKYAISLSHDVDTAWVLKHQNMLEQIHAIEDRYGFRSTWFLVADYLDDPRLDDALNWLSHLEHELASHGDNHDVRHAFTNDEERARRWNIIIRQARRFSMKGFRSAWLIRTNRFFDDIDRLNIFEYDSSVPNTYPHGVVNSNSGCASCMPFFIRPNIVEIPVLWFLEILNKEQDKWNLLKKMIEYVRTIGGIFTLAMHPQPHHSANPRMLDLYDRVLNVLAEDNDAWQCLQADAARAFRKQASSHE